LGENLIGDENHYIEYKNYGFPIEKIEIILKIKETICGFLNSKGGCLMIGIDDSSSEVRGIRLTH
jgi:predicted HTH transcriptional regulator